MAVVDRATAQAAAIVIRDEVVVGANTATRVGGAMLDIADSTQFLGETTGVSLARALSDSNIASLNGLATTVDGELMSTDGEQVLLTAQSTGSENGPWVVHSGAWTRPANFAPGSSAAGFLVNVTQGSTYADQIWNCDTDPPNDVVDTDALVFTRSLLSLAATLQEGNITGGTNVGFTSGDSANFLGEVSVQRQGVDVLTTTATTIALRKDTVNFQDAGGTTDTQWSNSIAVFGVPGFVGATGSGAGAGTAIGVVGGTGGATDGAGGPTSIVGGGGGGANGDGGLLTVGGGVAVGAGTHGLINVALGGVTHIQYAEDGASAVAGAGTMRTFHGYSQQGRNNADTLNTNLFSWGVLDTDNIAIGATTVVAEINYFAATSHVFDIGGATVASFDATSADFEGLALISTGTLSLGTTPAATGRGRFGNTDELRWRDSANTVDIRGIGIDVNEIVHVGEATNAVETHLEASTAIKALVGGSAQMTISTATVNIADNTFVTTGRLEVGSTISGDTTADLLVGNNTTIVSARNAANTANIPVLATNASDGITIGGANGLNVLIQHGTSKRFLTTASGVALSVGTTDYVFGQSSVLRFGASQARFVRVPSGGAPILYQENETTAVHADDLTIHAQDNTNAGAFDGGDLNLAGGTSVGGNAGLVNLQVAGATQVAVSATAVDYQDNAIITTGDVTIGATPATTGDLRVNHGFNVWGRNNGNTANVELIDFGSTVDTLFFGDATNLADMNFDVATSGTFTFNVNGSAVLAFDAATGFGFNGSAVFAPPSYTRNTTVVEDRTLLASASATTLNNNNVLAALIADLQSYGLAVGT